MNKADREFAKFLLDTNTKYKMTIACNSKRDITPGAGQYNPNKDAIKSKSPSATIKMNRID